METNKKATILLLLISLIAIATSLDCSNLYYKESEGVLNYLANVTLTVPYTTLTGWNFYMGFSRNFTGIGIWVGTIKINEPPLTAQMWNNSANGQLIAGERFSFRFRINWMEQTPAVNPPLLTSFAFLDLELCS